MSILRPLPPGPVLDDEEGNPLPQPAENSDVRDLIALMEWARQKGFELAGGVRVGKISVQRVRDLRQTEARRDKDEAPDPGVWADHGYSPSGDE